MPIGLQIHRCRLSRVAAALIVTIAGCRGPQGPATVEATGTVMQNKKPVANANVVFSPLGDSPNTLASQTVTDADGRFELSTQVGGGELKAGIVPGQYAVTIKKLDTAAISTTLSPPRNLLPKKYAESSTSGLTAEIVAGGANDFQFSLDSK